MFDIDLVGVVCFLFVCACFVVVFSFICFLVVCLFVCFVLLGVWFVWSSFVVVVFWGFLYLFFIVSLCLFLSLLFWFCSFGVFMRDCFV